MRYDYTEEIICPYCGYELSDSWEVEQGEEDIGLMECEECGESFYATRTVEVSYSTKKAEKGTCKRCGDKHVILESKCSSIGSYKDFCIACGIKANNEFRNQYFKEMEAGNEE